MLDEMEASSYSVFMEPTYLVWKNCGLFTIPLLDSAVQPAKPQLHPLSKVELAELRIQLKTILDSDCMVLGSSTYGHPILFMENKGGGGLSICIHYMRFKLNMFNDSRPLLHTNDHLAHLHGAKLFSKLDL